MNSIAVCIGRFQPFHLGHHALLSKALREADHVVVGLGSSFRARTPRNPFNWQERLEMIRGAFSSEEASRMTFVPLRDYFNLDRWIVASVKELQRTVQALTTTIEPQVTLYGQDFLRDTHDDLHGCDWQRKEMARHGAIDASKLRDILLGAYSGTTDGERTVNWQADALSSISGQLPGSVLSWLETQVPVTIWQYLSKEWLTLRRIQSAWSSTPFPPTFVTVDAVIRCKDKVLLIRRGKSPGEGLLALPGGFIEQHETVRDAALRELYEETRIGLTPQELKRSLVATHVFDHPQRSLFGRVVTHGHFFDLATPCLPSVQADDDAQSAHWVPIEELGDLEDQFHDDHFFILDHFLHLLD